MGGQEEKEEIFFFFFFHLRSSLDNDRNPVRKLLHDLLALALSVLYFIWGA